MKLLIGLFLIVLVVTACSSEYDKRIVIDAYGNVYQLEYRIGKVYAVKVLPMDQLDSLMIKEIKQLNK